MSIVNEIWKDIPDYEGYYQVSNLGRVRSLDRTLTLTSRGATYSRTKKGCVLAPSLQRGYYFVSLYRQLKPFRIAVHALVAQAFIGDRPKGFQVNHLDGNKLNNSFDNLEYCSPKENTRHAHATGLCDSKIGDNHHAAILRSVDIPVILDRLRRGDTCQKVADDYGVARYSITAISKGKLWKHAADPSMLLEDSRLRFGSVHYRAKLTEHDVPAIRQRLAAGESQYSIARDYGVNRGAIAKIKYGQNWKHVK